MGISTINMDILNEIMDKNENFGGKIFFRLLGMCAPWKKFGQKLWNFKKFFDIIDYYACLYMHVKFHQNRSKFGCIIARFSKMPRHGISIFAIFNHLRVIFELGNMLFSLSFFLPYLHLRLTVARDTEGVWENDKLCLLFKPRELETLGWPKSAPSNVDVLSAYIAVAGTAAVISFIVLVTPTFYRVVVVVLHFLRVLAASLEIGSMNFAPRVAQCNLAWKFWGVLQTLLHTSKELPYVPCHSWWEEGYELMMYIFDEKQLLPMLWRWSPKSGWGDHYAPSLLSQWLDFTPRNHEQSRPLVSALNSSLQVAKPCNLECSSFNFDYKVH